MQLVIVVTVLLLIIFNILVALKAFSDGLFYRKCMLHTDGVLISRQYPRLISAGFVHQSWTHLFFHMFVLLGFTLTLKSHLQLHSLLLAYVGGLLGGNLLALYTHRHDACFQSSGASGAISGLIMGILMLFPNESIQLFFFPIYFPTWVFGLSALIYSLYALRANNGRIMYEEHFGGGIAGGALMLLLHPAILQNYPFMALGFIAASLIFLRLMHSHQAYVPIVINKAEVIEEPVTIRVRPLHMARNLHSDKEAELNYLLDEVARVGLNRLSLSQKERLDELSQDPELF